MDVSGVQSQEAIQEMMRLRAQGQGKNGEGQVNGRMMQPPPDGIHTSQMGGIMENFSEMTDSEKEALKGFLDQVKQSVGSDAFNASALADGASDEMKALAEKYGVDLESALTELDEHASIMRKGERPPYGMMPPGMEDSSQETLDSIFETEETEEDEEEDV